MTKRDEIADENPEALWPDGFEEAFLGAARRPGQPTLAAFSVKKAIAILVERDGLNIEQAWEHFAFNVAHAYMGPGTPIWIDDTEDDPDDDEDEDDEDDDMAIGPPDRLRGPGEPCPAPDTTMRTATAGAIRPGSAASTPDSTASAASTSSGSASTTSSRH